MLVLQAKPMCFQLDALIEQVADVLYCVAVGQQASSFNRMLLQL